MCLCEGHKSDEALSSLTPSSIDQHISCGIKQKCDSLDHDDPASHTYLYRHMMYTIHTHTPVTEPM